MWQGEQHGTHIEDSNSLHVEDEHEVPGNVNFNYDIKNTFTITEEFSDAKDIFEDVDLDFNP